MSKDLARPQSLDQYLGQEHIKEILSVAMEAARQRNEPLDHVLLNGPPGLGKTTLAKIIANEMGWKFKTILAPSIGTPKEAGLLLMELPKRTILFIDEVHRLKRPAQETLYPVLEDGKLYSWLGPVELPLNPLTIIGATTNIGKLERPFIDRFGLQFQLEYYDDEQLISILTATAARLKVTITEPAIEIIAERSRGTPRIANNFLKRLRDFAQVRRDPGSAEFVVSTLWNKFGIDQFGLNSTDRRYLQALADGSTMGVEAVAAALQEEVDTVEGYLEPFLVKMGFIERGRTGRTITEKGLAHLRNPDPMALGG